MKHIRIAGMIDFPIFYQGIRYLCEEIEQVSFIGNHNDKNILKIIKDEEIDLLFIKRNNGTIDAFERQILRECKLRGIFPLVFMYGAEENAVRGYFEAGYKGILSAEIDAYELELAIRSIINGGFYVSQNLSSDLFDAIVNPDKMQRRSNLENSKLTRRETEIMQLICHEMTNQQIARKIGISPRTVEVHRLNIIRKLGVKNSIGIVKFAIQNEMVVQ